MMCHDAKSLALFQAIHGKLAASTERLDMILYARDWALRFSRERPEDIWLAEWVERLDAVLDAGGAPAAMERLYALMLSTDQHAIDMRSSSPFSGVLTAAQNGITQAHGPPTKQNRHLPPYMHKKGALYYFVSSSDGKRVWTKLSSSYAEALAMWARLEGTAAQDNSVGAAIDRFLAEILPTYSDKTRKEWPRMAGLLRSVFGEMPLSAVRPHHVARYLDERPAKVAANREIGLLSTIYSYAMRWGSCDTNPCRGVRRNKEKARTRYITDEEFLAIKEKANPQWQCIMDIAYLTALRKSNILRLRLSDIQDNLLVVQTSKTGKKQSFEITKELRAVLDRAKGLRRRIGSMYLFCTQDGQPYSENGSLWAWKRLCGRAGGKDAHFHDIRAKSLTDASRMAGRDEAQALAGHADGSMTWHRYAPETPRSLRLPAEL